MKTLGTIIVTACVMSIIAQVQERQAFRKGVGTTLCAHSAALGDSNTQACRNLGEKQRRYAISVGREIADKRQ